MGDSKYSGEVAAISRKRLAERMGAATTSEGEVPPPKGGGIAAFLKPSMALADYMTGELSADALIAAAREGSRTRICEAHYVVGVDALATGDRETAAHHFRESLKTNAFVYWEYDWSHAFLGRLEEDPTWPPWIPV